MHRILSSSAFFPEAWIWSKRNSVDSDFRMWRVSAYFICVISNASHALFRLCVTSRHVIVLRSFLPSRYANTVRWQPLSERSPWETLEYRRRKITCRCAAPRSHLSFHRKLSLRANGCEDEVTWCRGMRRSRTHVECIVGIILKRMSTCLDLCVYVALARSVLKSRDVPDFRRVTCGGLHTRGNRVNFKFRTNARVHGNLFLWTFHNNKPLPLNLEQWEID